MLVGINNNINKLILEKESLTLEFQESKSKLNKDLYDTVCSFQKESINEFSHTRQTVEALQKNKNIEGSSK